MRKECCFPLSRRLWVGKKYDLPQKRLRGRLHENQMSKSAVSRDLRFFVLIREDQKVTNRLQMSLQRQHFLLSYYKTLSVGPAWV